MTVSLSSVSIVVSTFDNPRALELVLLAYRRQSVNGFEVVVADDGSGHETADVVQRARSEGLRVRHVWHEDRGFRKTEALDRAILAAEGAYLVFTDGDCVPRSDFVDAHVRLAEHGRFLSGGYIKLPELTTAAIDSEAIRSGAAFHPAWLRERGYRMGRRRLRLGRSRAWAGALDGLTPTRATWNGHNASTWREHLLAVNGFDLDMGYGGEDRVLGVRLENLGIRGKQVRYRAVCLHLEHPRPYLDPEVLQANRRVRERARRSRETRAARGLDQLAGIDARERPDVRIGPPLREAATAPVGQGVAG